MFDVTTNLPVREVLSQANQQNPNDVRLELYDAIQSAVSTIDPWMHLTITTTTPIRDEILVEGLCRRFAHQLHRRVLGMRKKSKIPMLVVTEQNSKGVYHAHLLIGKIQGNQREQKDTTFKHYIQKSLSNSTIKILQRLTYDSRKDVPGRIGQVHFTPVYFKEGLVDYLLKEEKLNLLNVAWLATNINFNASAISDIPLCPNSRNTD